jgi:hypothetical protein
MPAAKGSARTPLDQLMENRKTVLLRYPFSSFNGAGIYYLASGRKLTKLSLAQLSPCLFFLSSSFAVIQNPRRGCRRVSNFCTGFSVTLILGFQ